MSDGQTMTVINGDVYVRLDGARFAPRPPTLGTRLAVASAQGALWLLPVLGVLVMAGARLTWRLARAGARAGGAGWRKVTVGLPTVQKVVLAVLTALSLAWIGVGVWSLVLLTG